MRPPFPQMNRLLTLTLLLAMITSAGAVEIIAHRGYSAIAPENTLAAFRLAWEKGADACENDIHLTSDGRIVVLHDKDTQRTAGVQKIVATSTAAELTALDVGTWKGAQWKGETLPTLEQALETLPAEGKRFYIEIKCGPEVVPALTQVLEPMKARAAQLAVISFNGQSAAKTKAAMPWLKVYLLMSGKDKKTKQPLDLAKVIAQAKQDGLDGLDLGSDWPWSEAMVKQIRDAGLGVYVWTINKPEQAKQLAALGVDGITTDNPVMVREAIGKK